MLLKSVRISTPEIYEEFAMIVMHKLFHNFKRAVAYAEWVDKTKCRAVRKLIQFFNNAPRLVHELAVLNFDSYIRMMPSYGIHSPQMIQRLLVVVNEYQICSKS